MQGQQQEQQQPQVVVVQQPIIINGRQKPTAPFMLRGYRFSSGKKCHGVFFVFMLVFGGAILIPGLSFFAMGFNADAEIYGLFVSIGFGISFVGALCFVPGLYCCCKARKDYNALPPDHPHRYKYGSGFVLPVMPPNATAVPANYTHTTYNFTPGVQVTSVQGPAGGSAPFQGYPSASPPYLQGTPGANTSYPQGYPGSKASSQMPPATNPYYHGHPEGYPGQTGPSQANPPPSPSAPYSGQSSDTYPRAANDDLPPSYSDIEANKCQ